MSESDYPFEVIQWEGPPDMTHDFLCRLTDEPEDLPGGGDGSRGIPQLAERY